MPKHLRAKEPQNFRDFERWAEANTREYDEMVEKVLMPGLTGEQLIERVFNQWKIKRGIS